MVSRLVHYRLAVHEVGKDITTFNNTKQFITAIQHAAKAHRVVYDKARILHRDISPSNILFTSDRTGGLLIDWDLSTNQNIDPSGNVRVLERTGSWQFMSGMLTADPGAPHTREDDLESFFYVICWVALRYTKNALSPGGLQYILGAHERGHLEEDKGWVDTLKQILITSGTYVALMKLHNAALIHILECLRTAVASRYIPETLSTTDDHRWFDGFLDDTLNTLPEEEWQNHSERVKNMVGSREQRCRRVPAAPPTRSPH